MYNYKKIYYIWRNFFNAYFDLKMDNEKIYFHAIIPLFISVKIKYDTINKKKFLICRVDDAVNERIVQR